MAQRKQNVKSAEGDRAVAIRELLGCPWCCSQPKLITQRTPPGSLGYKFGMQASLWCVNRKCQVQPQVSASVVRTFEMKNPHDLKESLPAFTSLEKSKIKAIEAVTKIWNTRKHPNNQAEP